MEQILLSSFLRKRKQRDKPDDLLKTKTLKVVGSDDLKANAEEVSSSLISPVFEQSNNELDPSYKNNLENADKKSSSVSMETKDSVEILKPLPDAEALAQRSYMKYRGWVSDSLPLPLKYVELWVLYEAMEISFEFCRSRKEHCLYDKIKKSVENTSHK